MEQTPALIEAVKRALKAHGKTYTDVGAALGLSTPSVKRLFSEQSLSLRRLDAICGMLGMEITDLLQQLAEEGWQLRQLSDAQERAIAEDIPLLLVTVAVLNRLTFEDILARFRIDEHEVVRKLAWLDRQGFIELLPHNRIRIKVASNFAWRPDGPIQRFFQRRISGEYFSSRFSAAGERLLVLNGILSETSLSRFHQRMEHLGREFEEFVESDRSQPIEDRLGRTVVVAVRSWAFGAFSDYLR